MKIIIAMDSFKGSLDSTSCGNAVKQGILTVYPDADIQVFPLADGGEGMAKTLSESLQAEWIPVTVSGPLGASVTAGYGYIKDQNLAIMEMASAAGLSLLPPEHYHPLTSTTFGVGELICHAIKNGCRNFIIGIGGSATNDGGTGMLRALGFQILDSNGCEIRNGAQDLSQIASVHLENVLPELSECSFQVACDVSNPLCGKNGATYIYGPQKGLLPGQLETIDQGMKHYSQIAENTLHRIVSDIPGTGAAGGMGFAFMCFLPAKLVPGAQLIIDTLNLESAIQEADLIITGEGRLDSQTILGKAPITVAQLAKKYHKKVIAFSGCLGANAELCNRHGIDAYFPILTDICSLSEALSEEKTKQNLKSTAEQVFRLIRLYNK